MFGNRQFQTGRGREKSHGQVIWGIGGGAGVGGRGVGACCIFPWVTWTGRFWKACVLIHRRLVEVGRVFYPTPIAC